MFADKLDWAYISQYQKLSESFIREFKDKVDWEEITLYQNLSEDFIREFKDYVDWNYITTHNNARSLIRRLDRDELLQEIVKDYLKLND